MRRERFHKDQRIGGTFAAAALFAPILCGMAQEQMGIALLDADLGLLKLVLFGGGCADAIGVPIRALIRDALCMEARAAVIAHNHPRGDARPSAADRIATRRLAEVTRLLGIRLIDHLIFGGGQVVSFRDLGLL